MPRLGLEPVPVRHRKDRLENFSVAELGLSGRVLDKSKYEVYYLQTIASFFFFSRYAGCDGPANPTKKERLPCVN